MASARERPEMRSSKTPLNAQYRITFAWVNDEPVDIEIGDYH